MKRQERDNEKTILEIKKDKFLEVVSKSAKRLGVQEPKVQFLEGYCPYDTGGEIAHIHPDTKIICISLYKLKAMTFEDIEKTASHEVSHLININHDDSFYKTQSEVESSLWEPQTGNGLIAIDGGDKEKPYEIEKKRKEKPDRIRCNYHLCRKKTKTYLCGYCGKYFCKEHSNPREPSVSRYPLEEKNTHPCLGYLQYELEQEEKQDKEYSEALRKMAMGKSYEEVEYEEYKETKKVVEKTKKIKNKKDVRKIVLENLKEKNKINPKKTWIQRIKEFF